VFLGLVVCHSVQRLGLPPPADRIPAHSRSSLQYDKFPERPDEYVRVQLKSGGWHLAPVEGHPDQVLVRARLFAHHWLRVNLSMYRLFVHVATFMCEYVTCSSPIHFLR